MLLSYIPLSGRFVARYLKSIDVHALKSRRFQALNRRVAAQ